MKQLAYVAFATLAFGFTSCTDKPEACFEAEHETAEVNTPVEVTANCSAHSKNFYWAAKDANGETLDDDLVTLEGDGYESTETFTFAEPGIYTLHLCASKGLFSDEIEQTIVIVDELPADTDDTDDDTGDDNVPTK